MRCPRFPIALRSLLRLRAPYGMTAPRLVLLHHMPHRMCLFFNLTGSDTKFNAPRDKTGEAEKTAGGRRRARSRFNDALPLFAQKQAIA